MTPARILALKYAMIALTATALNLALQALVLRAYDGPFAVETSMVLATGLITPIKYAVEKRAIFNFTARSIAHDVKHFSLYTFVSVFTVLIFWLTEYAFHLIFRSDSMRYLGGAIGLAISFYTKYRLDKRYVFGGGA